MAAAFLACATVDAASTARIDVRVRVLPFAHVNVQAVPSLRLSPADARTGIVHIDHAATLSVFCNRPSYALQFELTDPDVIDVEVSGLGSPVHVGSAGALVQVATSPGATSRTSHALGYRIRYAAGVSAGERPMPLRVSLEEG